MYTLGSHNSQSRHPAVRFFFFFFSSRRRHTRCLSDWSSDVCSSDLVDRAQVVQRSRLTVDDICTIDLEANQLEGKGNAPLERHLHCGIYRVRSDVRAIVHAHPKWSTFLTMVGESYKPVYAQGSLVYPMPLLDSPNSINTRAMADRLAATLGARPPALMKSHGAVTAGKDLVEAFGL